MDQHTKVTNATVGELHALWGMVEAHAHFNDEFALVLEQWEAYVLAHRERFKR